jgi:hypothetical protein
MITNQQKSDQGWQQLQDHINDFLGHALTSDRQSIEYKPRFGTMPEILSGRHQNAPKETNM